jgi:cobalt-zinc-cadmium efflux system protein
VGQTLLAVPGVLGIHDLHVQAASSGRVNLMAHAVYAPELPAAIVLDAIRDRLVHGFKIIYVIVQCERFHAG